MKMTNKEIFDLQIFDSPKSYEDGSYYEFLEKTYDEYLSNLLTFQGILKKEIIEKRSFIESQILLIKKSVKLYLDGFPSLAYDQISIALKSLESKEYLPIQKTDLPEANSFLYRVRLSESKTLKKTDLFHIPFQIREKVGSQRYSIPGLPCLYLADSAFVCWEELNRPDLSSFHISRFDLSQSEFKLLYFNTTTNDIRKQCFSNKNKEGQLFNLLVPFLCYWPMLIACSIIVRKPSEVFKPEYIVPQLLLQWIGTTQSIDGIVYKSNRIKISKHNLGTFKNIVIPSRKISSKGFCKDLKSKIKLTNPLSPQILEIAGEKYPKNAVEVADLRRAMYIELIEGEKTIYSETIFGKLESKLKLLPADYL